MHRSTVTGGAITMNDLSRLHGIPRAAAPAGSGGSIEPRSRTLLDAPKSGRPQSGRAVPQLPRTPHLRVVPENHHPIPKTWQRGMLAACCRDPLPGQRLLPGVFGQVLLLNGYMDDHRTLASDLRLPAAGCRGAWWWCAMTHHHDARKRGTAALPRAVPLLMRPLYDEPPSRC